jgi:F-type H+-transporting ATPase subunit epsilon
VAEFPARLVTPEAVIFDEQVEAVILRTGVGDATFMAGHCPLVGSVVPGLVRFVRSGGEVQRVAVQGGFVHMDGDGTVTVLPPSAELAEHIDVERARRSLESAESKLAELAAAGRMTSEQDRDQAHAVTDVEVEEAEAQKKRALVRIEVAGG